MSIRKARLVQAMLALVIGVSGAAFGTSLGHAPGLPHTEQFALNQASSEQLQRTAEASREIGRAVAAAQASTIAEREEASA